MTVVNSESIRLMICLNFCVIFMITVFHEHVYCFIQSLQSVTPTMSDFTGNTLYGDGSPINSARSSPYGSARQRPSRPSTGPDTEHQYMAGESLSDDVRAHLNMDFNSRNLLKRGQTGRG